MLHYDKKTFNHTRYPCLLISPNCKLIPIHQFPIPTTLFTLLSCQTQIGRYVSTYYYCSKNFLIMREREREGGYTCLYN